MIHFFFCLRDALHFFSARGGHTTNKKFIAEMAATVTKDSKSGKQKEFEKMYKKILKFSQETKESPSYDKCDIDCDALYGAEEDV